METILHGIGICSDNHLHIDLLDIIIGGVSGLGTYGTLKYYGTGIKLYITKLFKIKNEN